MTARGAEAQLWFPSTLLELPRKGLAGNRTTPPGSSPLSKGSSWQAVFGEQHCPVAATGPPCGNLHKSSLVIWHSWRADGILYGCCLTLPMRHYTWSYAESSQPACGRGNHSLTKGLVRTTSTLHVPVPRTTTAVPATQPAARSGLPSTSQAHASSKVASLKVVMEALNLFNMVTHIRTKTYTRMQLRDRYLQGVTFKRSG